MSRPFDRERAWSYVLNLLSRRSYTEAEVRERLARRQAEQSVIDEVIERLARYRLIDDEAFAEAYVRTHGRRKGSIALRHELRRKGISDGISQRSLEAVDDAAEIATAVRLIRRNAWRFRTAEARRGRARAFSFLARRGFPAEVVTRALEEAEDVVSGEQD